MAGRNIVATDFPWYPMILTQNLLVAHRVVSLLGILCLEISALSSRNSRLSAYHPVTEIAAIVFRRRPQY